MPVLYDVDEAVIFETRAVSDLHRKIHPTQQFSATADFSLNFWRRTSVRDHSRKLLQISCQTPFEQS